MREEIKELLARADELIKDNKKLIGEIAQEITLCWDLILESEGLGTIQ